MTKIFDPLEAAQAKAQVQQSTSLESNSRAMDNSDPSKCPKCTQGMVLQGLNANEQVHYCTKCRVSSPQLIG
jgi:acetyl-CoA carboxylase beta subunit